MAKRIIAHATLADKGITYSKPHLWRLEKAGRFPKRVALSPHRYGYVEAEIDAYVEAKISERDCA